MPRNALALEPSRLLDEGPERLRGGHRLLSLQDHWYGQDIRYGTNFGPKRFEKNPPRQLGGLSAVCVRSGLQPDEDVAEAGDTGGNVPVEVERAGDRNL